WKHIGVAPGLRRAFFYVLIFSLFVNLLIFISPIYMLQIYDRVLITQRTETLLYLTLIAMGGLVVLGMLDGVRGFLLARVGRYMDLTLRDPLLQQTIERTRRDGANRRRLLEDLHTARSFMGSPSVLPLFDAPWVPLFIVAIAMLHPWLGMLAAGSAIFLFLLALLNNRLSVGPLRQAAGQQAQVSDLVNAAIANAEVVQAMGMQDAVSDRHRKQIGEMAKTSQTAVDRTAVISSISKAVRIGVQVAILGLGALLVMRAELTPGGMISASIVLGRALAPIEQSINAWRHFIGARDAYRRVRDFLIEQPVEETRINLPDIRGFVSVDGLSYALPGTQKMVLKRISFRIEPGTCVAMIGPSASGKSTLCRLMVGAWAPSVGHVRLDGADVTTLNPQNVRDAVGYLPQNVELFAGTVRENIARMGPADDDEVIAAAMAAGCHEMILHLPDSYDTQVGSQGMFLSGGQRQRIGLARALFGNPKLIILDEPNSNLDQEGEMALVEAMRQRKADGATIIVVSHRFTILQPVDKIALLRDGALERYDDRDVVLKELAPNAVPQRKQDVPSNTPANVPATIEPAVAKAAAAQSAGGQSAGGQSARGSMRSGSGGPNLSGSATASFSPTTLASTKGAGPAAGKTEPTSGGS
ncbi:MAG: type I secretion system permease/ATPase, partial [Pseudomonadota bacterium]